MKKRVGVRSTERNLLLITGALILAPPGVVAQVKGPLTSSKAPVPPPISRPVQPEGASGTLEQITGDVLTLRTPQGRRVDVLLSSSTKYFLGDRVVVAESLKRGDFVRVILKPGERGVFFAETVTVDTPKAEEPVLLKHRSRGVATRRSEDTPDDPGRPILRRTPPPKHSESEAAGTETPPAETAETTETVPEEPSAEAHPESAPEKESARESESENSSVISVDAVAQPANLIDRAREQAAAYSAELPNFICREVMTRTVRESHGGDWHTLDVVEADLVYEDGKEDYRNIRVGGKPQTGTMDELNGSSSTGEFASTLLSLFAPQTDTDFRFVRTETANSESASVYDFSVKQPSSNWDVHADGKSTKPAYKGSVWIADESARALRLEQQAVDLAADFPLDTIEMSVDYRNVRIGDQEYLLPVASENLACWRGTNNCALNKIEFRNYRKFAAESTIVTTDSDITYEGQKTPKQ